MYLNFHNLVLNRLIEIVDLVSWCLWVEMCTTVHLIEL